MEQRKTSTFTYGMRAGKALRCAYDCGYPQISLGEPIIRSSTWFRNTGHVRQRSYHPLCWLDQTLAYIDTLPIVHKPRNPNGRPRIIHSDDQRRARTKLSTRMNRIRTRKEYAIKHGWWWRMEMLDNEVKLIRQEYETLGGVPSTWAS